MSLVLVVSNQNSFNITRLIFHKECRNHLPFPFVIPLFVKVSVEG
jgi:hypothetical protein